jgi:glycerophosphoryl diester phosphodiesterase
MADIDWMIARPIAHRGLHDGARTIENTPSAFNAAIAAGYGIECDLQLASDGDAMVHHDWALGRLTNGQGRLADMPADMLRQVPFRSTGDRMMTLAELFDLVAGRVPLFLELKSLFDGDRRLAERVADLLRGYSGPVAVMSFDPEVVSAMRELSDATPRGIVAERRYDDPEWAWMTAMQRFAMARLLHANSTRPQFVAYKVRDLPALGPRLARAFGAPVLAWTVRTGEDRERARRYASQMIFEGFRP